MKQQARVGIGDFRIAFSKLAKRISLAIVAIGVVVGVSAVQATQVTTVPGFGPFHVGIGGEFTLMPDAGVTTALGPYSPLASGYVSPGSFQTFCVERNEVIYSGTTYDVTFNTATMYGGATLTRGAAYLYQQFATGSLALYPYLNSPAGSRGTSAAELQQAIWYFMGQSAFDAGNVYENGAVALPSNPFGANSGAFNVGILNLWTVGMPHTPDNAHQDQLYLLPVPEPTSFMLGGLGVAAMLIFRRRRN